LDRHASLLAEGKLSEVSGNHFQNFISTFKSHHYPEEYLSDMISPVSQAYWAFLNSL
jgi:hypothetical protein